MLVAEAEQRRKKENVLLPHPPVLKKVLEQHSRVDGLAENFSPLIADTFSDTSHLGKIVVNEGYRYLGFVHNPDMMPTITHDLREGMYLFMNVPRMTVKNLHIAKIFFPFHCHPKCWKPSVQQGPWQSMASLIEFLLIKSLLRSASHTCAVPISYLHEMKYSLLSSLLQCSDDRALSQSFSSPPWPSLWGPMGE